MRVCSYTSMNEQCRERETQRQRQIDKGRERENTCMCVMHVFVYACLVKSWMKLLQLNCRRRKGKKNDSVQFSLSEETGGLS